MPDNNINMGDILRSQGTKGEFDKKAKVSIDKAQEGAWDKSILIIKTPLLNTTQMKSSAKETTQCR